MTTTIDIQVEGIEAQARNMAGRIADFIELRGHYPDVEDGCCIVSNPAYSDRSDEVALVLLNLLREKIGLDLVMPDDEKYGAWFEIFRWNDSTAGVRVVRVLREIETGQ